MTNPLIAILSCASFGTRRARCLATWIPEARERGIDVVFVVGSPGAAAVLRDGSLLVVPAVDDYASLPQKIRETCVWTLAATDCEYLFKCDDDTYVRIDRLLTVDLRGKDYLGAEWTPNTGYASGGAGYFLSRRAIRIVGESLLEAAAEPYPIGAEDMLVGRCLRKAGIGMTIDPRFIPFGDEQLRPRPENALITAHACQWPWLAHRVEFGREAPVITCRTSGDLGNLLFQVAAAVGYATRYGTHRALFEARSLGTYRNTVFRKLAVGAVPDECLSVGDAPDFSFNRIAHAPSYSISICGYMQSEKYFADVGETIRSLFQPSAAERRCLEDKYSSLLDPNTISLHVRRGDYVAKQEYHPLQTAEYYARAIRHIERLQSVSRILCFSDDQTWCKDNLPVDSRMHFVEGEPDHLELALMSMCRHHIVSNSSIAWWGAWLNPNADKIVVAPQRWLGPAFSGWTDRDIIPAGWLRSDGILKESDEIDVCGYWRSRERLPDHAFDQGVCEALTAFFKGHAETVVDFGCGTGDYIRMFKAAGITCDGFDGNPFTEELSEGVARVLDLSEKVDLGKAFDWVLSLEVGEHIPLEFESTFIENLHRHNLHGIILSWAVPGQGGKGHVNERDNDYVRERFHGLGYDDGQNLERVLREAVGVCSWLKNTIMVFRRTGP